MTGTTGFRSRRFTHISRHAWKAVVRKIMDIKLPELGEGIESGDVLSVLVSEGDTVAKDQGLIELETDKASVEIPSTHAGTITKIHVNAGQTLGVGGVIVSL